ncbi:3-oxo-5-alpha-steroid 4-dehydrogenase-domain-containing protein [Crepidotus variabilis]|uniref:3-oxo-5-alpha-steroid 4-dehydrogenase-domain-containing protein n=1 Tax=Crepidotus variabilis TaxID=179855 RepID=A0A9P6E4V5_9AGAR|nr:3-oxo-5-alpha-steroid 4-dehydrogenase-domain-containing protein [Crepidotus variabilis]
MRHPTLSYSTGNSLYVYNEARKWFPIIFSIANPIMFLFNAPFGRFTLKNQSSIFLVDGRIAWTIMELPSPCFFLYNFFTAPLAVAAPPVPFTLASLTKPYNILALCFVMHYVNRAIVSPLRTPSRSKSHIIVPFAAIIFNTLNGSLMGAYLSSPFARIYLSETRPAFFVGLGMYVLGLAGNIYHDEILFNLRRKANTKGKANENDAKAGEHYAIPQGGLYALISYPNYFTEWIEWWGFAMAAAPPPFYLSTLTVSSLLKVVNPMTLFSILTTPAHRWAPTFSPPWVFLFVEVAVMFPRAIRGHQWYHNKFPDSYPKERKAVIPFIV